LIIIFFLFHFRRQISGSHSYPPELGDREPVSAAAKPSVATRNYLLDVHINGGNHSMAQYGMTRTCSGDLPQTSVNSRGAHHVNPDMLASANFSLAEYEKTRLLEKSERMEYQCNDHVAHSVGRHDKCDAYDVDADNNGNNPDDEKTELLLEDRVLLVNRFPVQADIMDPIIGVRVDLSNGVKTEKHAASNLKRCAGTASLMAAKHNVVMVMPYDQHVMACVLVSEVLQLLLTDPEGYIDTLMNDESR
jgi:hypothetical protein